MVQSARRELRAKFLSAEVGISGANFLVADGAYRHQRGQRRADHDPAQVHIVTAGIEKLVPSTAHAMALHLRCLDALVADPVHDVPLRAEAGRRRGRAEEMHIVLVDIGRTRMPGEGLREMCAASAAVPA